MFPPLTLKNRRHESFALLLAEGHPAPLAYVQAGYTGNNAKARAEHLANDPDVRDRVNFLRSTLPRIHALQDHFAPSCLLMPETKEQMKAWLWQVTSGARPILPYQLRSAGLFCRLNGWHLTKPLPAGEEPSPAKLGREERLFLIDFIKQTIQADANEALVPKDELHAFLSTMADAFLAATAKYTFTDDFESVAAAFTPAAPGEPSTPMQDAVAADFPVSRSPAAAKHRAAAHAALVQTLRDHLAETPSPSSVPPPASSPQTSPPPAPPQTSAKQSQSQPPQTSAASHSSAPIPKSSPSQLADPQPPASENPQMGKISHPGQPPVTPPKSSPIPPRPVTPSRTCDEARVLPPRASRPRWTSH